MQYEFKPRGVCTHTIQFALEDDKLHNVTFLGGCSGNTQGIGRLTEGMDAHEAAARLRGIHCGRKNTSCPDQLAQALAAALDGSLPGKDK